jgi:hypothetical protein
MYSTFKIQPFCKQEKHIIQCDMFPYLIQTEISILRFFADQLICGLSSRKLENVGNLTPEIIDLASDWRKH